MKSNIELLHDADLEIVKEVVALCDRHELKYWMLGGTMLGAIRHRGFIPWDDDIDIGLPRMDYEKFLELAPRELSANLKIVNYKTDPEYHYYITRVLDTDTKVIENRFAAEGKYTNVSIDIFPLDGFPNNSTLRNIHGKRILAHKFMSSLHYKNVIVTKGRSFFERFVIKTLQLLPTDKMFSFTKQLDKCDKLLKKYDMVGSDYTGNIMGAYRTREIVPTAWYGEDTFYDFENIRLRGFKEYDKYLKHLYGDYMQLPPEDKRRIHFTIVEVHGIQVEKFNKYTPK